MPVSNPVNALVTINSSILPSTSSCLYSDSGHDRSARPPRHLCCQDICGVRPVWLRLSRWHIGKTDDQRRLRPIHAITDQHAARKLDTSTRRFEHGCAAQGEHLLIAERPGQRPIFHGVDCPCEHALCIAQETRDDRQ